jgi:hypothetical protein
MRVRRVGRRQQMAADPFETTIQLTRPTHGAPEESKATRREFVGAGPAELPA